MRAYNSGEKRHFDIAFTYDVKNGDHLGLIHNEHPGLECVFSVSPKTHSNSEISIRRRTHRISSNQLLIYNASEKHDEIFHQRDQRFQAMVFPIHTIQKLIGKNISAEEILFDQTFTAFVPFVHFTRSAFKLLHQDDLDASTTLGLVDGFLVDLFYAMAKHHPALKNPVQTYQIDLAHKIAHWIYREFQNPELTLNDSEAALGVTKFHIIRAFKSYYGCTPHQYLTRLRLEYSKNLLAQTTMNIIEIASRAGFNDLSAFNKAFKRNFGCPPSQYRAHRGSSSERGR